MSLPDLAIRRPVLAAVANVPIVLSGTMSLHGLPVPELPQTEAVRITVFASYTGAAPDVVDSQVASLIEGALAGISGLERLETESERGRARTVLTFEASADIEAAANDVRTAVDRVAGDLPDGADAPVVRKNDDQGEPVLRLSLCSPAMSPLELSD